MAEERNGVGERINEERGWLNDKIKKLKHLREFSSLVIYLVEYAICKFFGGDTFHKFPVGRFPVGP